MFKKCPVWSIFKHHHPSKRLFFLTIAKEVHEVLVIHFGQCRDLETKINITRLRPCTKQSNCQQECKDSSIHTWFLKWASYSSDHSTADVTIVDVTAISTPLESVPLYNEQLDKEPIMLLNCSHAVSSSNRRSDGTPAIDACNHECQKSLTRNVYNIKR